MLNENLSDNSEEFLCIALLCSHFLQKLQRGNLHKASSYRVVNRRNAIAKHKALCITSTMATLDFLIQSGRASYFCQANHNREVAFCLLKLCILHNWTLTTQLLLKRIKYLYIRYMLIKRTSVSNFYLRFYYFL